MLAQWLERSYFFDACSVRFRNISQQIYIVLNFCTSVFILKNWFSHFLGVVFLCVENKF